MWTTVVWNHEIKGLPAIYVHQTSYNVWKQHVYIQSLMAVKMHGSNTNQSFTCNHMHSSIIKSVYQCAFM